MFEFDQMFDGRSIGIYKVFIESCLVVFET